MLLVETKVDRSPIHGVGLFAGQHIPRDTKVWELNAIVDIAIDPSDLERLPEPALSVVKRLSYFSEDMDKCILSADGAQYMNHSDDPNAGDDVALRDIAKGEELTGNYHDEYDEEPDGESGMGNGSNPPAGGPNVQRRSSGRYRESGPGL